MDEVRQGDQIILPFVIDVGGLGDKDSPTLSEMFWNGTSFQQILVSMKEELRAQTPAHLQAPYGIPSGPGIFFHSNEFVKLGSINGPTDFRQELSEHTAGYVRIGDASGLRHVLGKSAVNRFAPRLSGILRESSRTVRFLAFFENSFEICERAKQVGRVSVTVVKPLQNRAENGMFGHPTWNAFALNDNTYSRVITRNGPVPQILKNMGVAMKVTRLSHRQVNKGTINP